MKSTIFREILNVEIIEVNKNVAETINNLRQQSSICYTPASNNITIHFECSKKGKICVTSSFGRHRDLLGFGYIYYVYGNVTSKNNKTYIEISSVRKKSDILLRLLILLSLIIITPILLILRTNLFLPALFISLVVLFIGIIDFINTTSIRKQNALEMVSLMENEIKKRVQNLERWND